MNSYTLIMATRRVGNHPVIPSSIPWRYEFESENDSMALDTARKLLTHDLAAKTALAVALFSKNKCLVEFEVRSTEIREILQ